MTKDREKLFDAIVKLMDNNETLPWAKGWTTLRPHNVQTKNQYNGYNLIATLTHPYWSTYRGWAKVGAKVRKKEKGTLILTPNLRKNYDDDGEVISNYIYFGTAHVFNSDQVDGWETPPWKHQPFVDIDTAEKVVSSMPKKPEVKHGGNRACYNQAFDIVKMPDKERFDKPEEYYSTLAHELTHSTLHESRLNRKTPVDLESEHAYSREELVAELGACFLSSSMHIEPNINNNAAYIKHWKDKIKGDPGILADAAKDAGKAEMFILGKTYASKVRQQ
tara:strand:+ start:641 stop:1471 length:831 start_codon:yes stop_codon:yes gene_type:complete